MIHPTIHLNGTSKERLIEGWSDAFDALRVALEKLAEAAPNGRDYYVQKSGAYELARQEHVDRMRKIQSVMVDLQTLCEVATSPVDLPRST